MTGLDRMQAHFGNLAPFEHHTLDKFGGALDQDQAVGDFDHFQQNN